MEQRTCRTCIYYRQHYSLNQRQIFQVYCGHCTNQRTKTKRPDSKACENYTQVKQGEEPFVTKEYLSKALLEYMLSMDLLPEIHEISD